MWVWYYNTMKSDKSSKANKSTANYQKGFVSKNEEKLKKLIQSQIPLSNDVFMVFAKK